MQPFSGVCERDDEPFSIRAIGLSEPRDVEVVLDSGADGSVLPLEYGHIGQPDPSFDGSSFVDAQGKPICIKDARIAEVRFGSVIFKERFIIAAVTSPLISMGRLLKEGWYLERDSDGMFLARNSRIKLDEKRPIIQGWEC